MKRINPKTNTPFKNGDIREDGYIFWCYDKVVKQDGFRREKWYSPERFERYSEETRVRGRKRLARKNLTPQGRAKVLYHGAKRRCKERGYGQVEITEKWILDKLLLGACELTGLPFDFSTPDKKDSTHPFSPSLDRIDNSNPYYSEANTRVVLTCVNLAINSYGLETMRPIFKILGSIPSY